MPTGFFIWGYMYPLPSFLGVHQHFWGCNVPSNSSFGDTQKMNCIFSTQGCAPCCFLNVRPKKKICVYCHMSKKSRVGRSGLIFFLYYRQNRKQSFPVPESDSSISFSKFSKFSTNYVVFLPSLLSISTKSQQQQLNK